MVLSFLTPLSAQVADVFTVKGKLVDKEQHKPVDFAQLALITAKDSAFVQGATTDGRGSFAMKRIAPGSYLLRCFSFGHRLRFVPVEVAGDVVIDTIEMTPNSNDLHEVVVKGEKPLYAVEGEKNIYNVTEDPGVAGGTASDALQNAPGVEVDLEGNVSLRGTSGVDIWIDGKPSRLNAENLKTYIQQLPADALESVEVITNPSARYGTSGSSGIINLVMKRKVLKNQFVSLGGMLDSRLSTHEWLSYVWANEKLSLNIYGNFGRRVNKSFTASNAIAFQDTSHTDTIMEKRSKVNSRRTGNSPYMGVNFSYNLDTANTVALRASGYFNQSRGNSINRQFRKEFHPDTTAYDYMETHCKADESYWASFGLSYDHHFKKEGHLITAEIRSDLSGSNGNADNFRLSNNGNMSHRYYTAADYSRHYGLGGELDYVLPYSKYGTVEMGLETNYGAYRQGSSTDTVQGLEDTASAGQIFAGGSVSPRFVKNDSLRSYNLHTTELEMELYATWQHTWGGFTVKAGLRGEFHRNGGRFAGLPQYDNHYWHKHVLPSLHLTYRTKNMHNFSLGYVLRPHAPHFEDLCEYRYYGEEDFTTGNPLLEHTTTHSIDGGWTKYFNKFGSVGVNGYYRMTFDDRSSVTEMVYDDFFGREVPCTKPYNVDKLYKGGAEFRVTARPRKFMNIRFYANLYDSYFYAQLPGHEDLRDVHKFSYSFRLSFWAKFWNRLNVNASAYYGSKTYDLYSMTGARYSINAGLGCSFFKDRLNIYVRVRNIFNWNEQEGGSENPYYESDYHTTNITGGRFISGGIRLKLGKMELEKLSTGGDIKQNAEFE